MGESDEPPTGTLQHLLDAMQEHSPALHLMDTCAIRTLVLQRPRLMQVCQRRLMTALQLQLPLVVLCCTNPNTLTLALGCAEAVRRVAEPPSLCSACAS